MRVLIIFLVFILFFGGGLILLQIFLSKRENKFLGLIMPAIIFGLSLLAVFSNLAFIGNRSTRLAVTDENGIVTEERVFPEESGAAESLQDLPSLIFASASILFIYNLPAAVLLAIYFACRQKWRRQKNLEKMQVQDLE